MILIEKEVWVIVTKDRKMIAKGVPRNRYLIPIDDLKDKKRILTYSSKGMAIAGYTGSGFYGSLGFHYKEDDFEAVKAKLIVAIGDETE